MNVFEIFHPSNMNEYLEHFNRLDYSSAFEKYMSASQGATEYIVGNLSAEQASAEAVAYMESHINGLRRKRRLCDQRYFLMLYVIPMLLRRGGAEHRGLAEAVYEGWVKAHPGQGFGMAEYSQLASGFNDTVLGFKISTGGKE